MNKTQRNDDGYFSGGYSPLIWLLAVVAVVLIILLATGNL